MSALAAAFDGLPVRADLAQLAGGSVIHTLRSFSEQNQRWHRQDIAEISRAFSRLTAVPAATVGIGAGQTLRQSLAYRQGVNRLPQAYQDIGRQLAERYALCFPNDVDWLDEPLHWTHEDAVEASIYRFLERVDARCFPLETELFWFVGLDIARCALYRPLLSPQGIGLNDTWPQPFPLLKALLTDPDEHFFPWDDAANRADPPWSFIVALRTLELPPPLDALPDLLEMLLEEAGNPFLDYTPEQTDDCLYDWEDAPELRELWLQAEPIRERVQALLDWQGDDKEAAVWAALEAAQCNS